MTSLSDVPLELPADAPCMHDTFPAKYVTQYLEQYVDRHTYNGKSIRDRIHFNTPVQSIAKVGQEWILNFSQGVVRSLICSRIAVASGLTSIPSIPTIPRLGGHDLPFVHHRDFGRLEESILGPGSSYENITVLGGGKSAVDLVYGAIKAGKAVRWLIRKTGGEGPGIFVDPTASAPYRMAVEAAATRRASSLNPSAFRSPTWLSNLHHQSSSGRRLLKDKFLVTDRRCKSFADYSSREGALPGFRLLTPRASFFWSSGPIGVIQQPDFWDLVSRTVEVFIGDIEGSLEHNILLKDGRTVPTDVILGGTGWISAYPFLNEEQTRQLGLPHERRGGSECDLQAWDRLMDEANHAILQQFPILQEAERIRIEGRRDFTLTPARLYRGIAPLDDSSILFLGRSRVANNFRTAEAQAIWATAFWDNLVPLPTPENMRRDVAYHNAFSRQRYPTRGGDGVNFHADLIWYTDTLVTEAGLTSHRKEWWSDWNEPCLATDFRDCEAEYISYHGRQ